jgi:hypothetical protein
MNQKIIPIILAVILLAVGAVYYVATQKERGPQESTQETGFNEKDSASSPLDSAESGSAADKIQGWEVFRDDVLFNFEIKYPPDWHQSVHGPNLVLSVINDPYAPTFVVRGVGGYNALLSIEEIFDGVREKKIDFQNECSEVTFIGVPAYDCELKEDFYIGKRNIIFVNSGIFYIISDGIQNDVTEKIFSTFKFIE